MLTHPSLSKIQADFIDQFFFSHSFPGSHGVIVIVPHEVYCLLHGDPMFLHEVVDPWVCFNFLGLCLSPGGLDSLWWRFFSSSRVPPMLGQMATLSVADEAFVVPHMLCSLLRGKVDLVNVHGVGVPSNILGWLGHGNITVSSTSELPESYHISVKLSCLIKPLFPFPGGLSVRRSHSSHHDSELVGYPSLEGIHHDAVIIHSTACLSQSKGCGVFIKIATELVHVTHSVPKDPRMLLRPDRRYSLGDQCPSGLSGRVGEE